MGYSKRDRPVAEERTRDCASRLSGQSRSRNRPATRALRSARRYEMKTPVTAARRDTLQMYRRARLVTLCPGAPGTGEPDDEQDDRDGDAKEDEPDAEQD